MPWAIFWSAIGVFLILMGFFASDSTWDEDFPRSMALFFGAWSIGFAILWFFFGSIDLSVWNEIKRRLGKGKSEQAAEEEEPVESVTSEKSDGGLNGLPSTFLGWCAALAGACGLIWFLVSIVANLCNALLQ